MIGLTTYLEHSHFGQEALAAVLPIAYVRAVHDSGGRAVLITPDDPGTDVLDGLDGIIFTGGADVDPARYGEQPHRTTYLRPERDTAEMLLLDAALGSDLPILGICRGMQLMTVAYGGRLYQHLPDLLGHDRHRPAFAAEMAAGAVRSAVPTDVPPSTDVPVSADVALSTDVPVSSGVPVSTGVPVPAGVPVPVSVQPFGEHPVRLVPGSLACKVLGETLVVNSLHHQGVASPGRLTPVGWCPEDDLIEVVEDPARPFTLGVQWHPETTADFRLFAALVEAARERRVCRAAPPPDQPR